MADEPTTKREPVRLEDPNREAVGLEPAWVEGTGGPDGDAAPKGKAKTKAETDDDDAKARAKAKTEAETKTAGKEG